MKQQTAAKLRKMNMGAMVDAAESIDGRSAGMAKEDWLEILVDHLYEERMSNRVTNSIRAAHLPCPDACVEDLITDSERRLDLGLIDSLAACTYITRGRDVVIMGAAGAGKSWLASALGVSACRRLFRVECVNMLEMCDELAILRQTPDAHARRLKQLRNRQLLIVDDWLLRETGQDAVDELFAVVDARNKTRHSTIVCTQYTIEGWPQRMGGYPAAESIVDRIRNNSYKVLLQGDKSMRERCMGDDIRRQRAD